jgi:hypothetical protein
VVKDADQPLKARARVKAPRKARASIAEVKPKVGKTRETENVAGITPEGVDGFISDSPEKAAAEIKRHAEVLLDVIRTVDPEAMLPAREILVTYGRLANNVGDTGFGSGMTGDRKSRQRIPSVQVLFPENKSVNTSGRVWIMLPYSFKNPGDVIARVLAGLVTVVNFDYATGRANTKKVSETMEALGFVGGLDPKGNGAQRRAPTLASWWPHARLDKIVRAHIRDHGGITMIPLTQTQKRDQSKRSSWFRWSCTMPGCKGGFSMTKEEDAVYRGAVKEGKCFMTIAPCGHSPLGYLLKQAPGTPTTEMPPQPKGSKAKVGLAKDANTGKTLENDAIDAIDALKEGLKE